MANIMITEACNLNCSYCFANEFVNNAESRNMSLEAYKEIIRYHKDTSERIGIIGGEPTIHPEFESFIAYALESTQENPILIFSNGLNLPQYWKSLIDPRVNVLLNYNGSNICGADKFNTLQHSVQKLFEDYGVGSKISFGINLYSNSMDLNYFFDTLVKYQKSQCRVSVTVPNSSNSRGFNALRYFREIKPIVLRFLEGCYLHNIRPDFDCGILPNCIFDEEDMKLIHKVSDLFPQSNMMRLPYCSPVLDIRSDLSVVRCFGMSDYKKVLLSQFNSLQECREYFSAMIDPVGKLLPMSSECDTCKSYALGKCTGGCLGYKASKMQKVAQMLGEYIDSEIIQ